METADVVQGDGVVADHLHCWLTPSDTGGTASTVAVTIPFPFSTALRHVTALLHVPVLVRVLLEGRGAGHKVVEVVGEGVEVNDEEDHG